MEVRKAKGRIPAYDLEEAKRLVAAGRYVTTSRVRRYIINHWDDAPEHVIGEVFRAAAADGFRKSLALDSYPDIVADVYRVDYEGEGWYLKFFEADEGGIYVNIISCCQEDHYYH